jgi:hypothetical protein
MVASIVYSPGRCPSHIHSQAPPPLECLVVGSVCPPAASTPSAAQVRTTAASQNVTATTTSSPHDHALRLIPPPRVRRAHAGRYAQAWDLHPRRAAVLSIRIAQAACHAQPLLYHASTRLFASPPLPPCPRAGRIHRVWPPRRPTPSQVASRIGTLSIAALPSACLDEALGGVRLPREHVDGGTGGGLPELDLDPQGPGDSRGVTREKAAALTLTTPAK